MVDTINPQTGSVDTFSQNVGSQPATGQNNNYFAGFSKPDDVKVNFAAEGPVAGQTPPPISQATPSILDATQNSAPRVDNTIAPQPQQAETPHVAYSTSKNPINFKAIAFMSVIGIVAIAVFGAGSYFISHSLYASKLTELNKDLDSAKSELAAQQIVPTALELPKKEEVPASTQPTTETPAETEEKPAPAVEQKPVETPEPTSPSVNNEGMG